MQSPASPLVHWMAAAASRDLERSCDAAAVAGRAAAFREKGRLIQLHLPLALPGGGAGADGGGEVF